MSFEEMLDWQKVGQARNSESSSWEIVARPLAQERFAMVLLGIFAGLAVILAAVGIFGVISYSVAQRTHEIGIRVAVGAGQRDVLRLVLEQGMILALLGLAAGLAGAWGLTRFLATLLYGVRPTDPVTLVAVSILLAVVGLAASYIPARRAMKIDPIVALRYE